MFILLAFLNFSVLGDMSHFKGTIGLQNVDIEVMLGGNNVERQGFRQ